MASMLEKSKNLSYCETSVTVKSALNAASAADIEKLAEELAK
jgi:hypothetical protein